MKIRREISLVERIILAGVTATMGLEEAMRQMLRGVPVNEAFDHVTPNWKTQYKYAVKVMPKHSSYLQDMGHTARIIDLNGPYESVPDFVIVSDEKERKLILGTSEHDVTGHKQNQLIVLDNGVFFRQLQLNGYAGKTEINNIEGIHFSRGYCVSRNEKSYAAGLYQCDTNPSLILEQTIKGMVRYFLDYNCDLYPELISNKIVFGSKRSRDSIIIALGENGLKKVE